MRSSPPAKGGVRWKGKARGEGASGSEKEKQEAVLRDGGALLERAQWFDEGEDGDDGNEQGDVVADEGEKDELEHPEADEVLKEEGGQQVEEDGDDTQSER